MERAANLDDFKIDWIHSLRISGLPKVVVEQERAEYPLSTCKHHSGMYLVVVRNTTVD